MIGGHVTRSFSAALDGDLQGKDAERFTTHLSRCQRCRRDYAVFRSGVSALRTLPMAHMPQPVHIPHTAPAAPQPISLRPPRRFVPAFGGATAVAAVIAAVVLLVGHAAPRGAGSSSAGIGSQAAPAVGESPSACIATVPAIANATVPTQLQHVLTATDVSRPGERLIVGTPSTTVVAGGNLEVYAVLATQGQLAGASRSVASCVRVSGLPGSVPEARPQAAPRGFGTSAPLLLVPVPASTQAGAVLDIDVSVAAGSPVAGEKTLAVHLTVRVSG